MDVFASDLFRRVFEDVVRACLKAGLVGGEGFAIEASVIEGAPAAIVVSRTSWRLSRRGVRIADTYNREGNNGG